MRRRDAILICALLAAATTAAARDYEARLRLDPRGPVGVDEVVDLVLTIDSGGARQPTPRPDFRLENFRLVGGPSTSQSLRIMNGVPSRSMTLTWRLQPLEVGRARVHGASVALGDEMFELPDQVVEVRAETPPERRGRRRGDPFGDPFARRGDPFDRLFEDPFDSVFDRRRRRRADPTPPKIYLRAEARPANPYVGQQVLYTLYLYTQVDVRSVNPEELPDFKGFWTRVIPQPEQLQPDMVFQDDERIGKVVLLQRALFPRRAGRFEIEPVSARLAALVPDSGPFGSLLPRHREISRSSNPVTIDVRELPPAPPGFQGAVGELRIAAELAPDELEVGEAATLTLTLEGKGHLQGLPAPELPELDGVEVFPPQQQSNESVRRKNVSGERTWSFVLLPQRPGEWTLPAIEVPYFDPRRGVYRTASTEPVELAVRGAAGLAQDDAGQVVELHSIRTAALPAVGGGGSGWRRLLPWLFGLPWALGLVLIALRRRGGAGFRNPERGELARRLSEAAGVERPRRAAARIEEAWREYLHRRWGLPRGTPSPRWAALLAERGVRPATAEELVKLADDLHYLRYAPKLSSTEELRKELIARSRKLARALG